MPASVVHVSVKVVVVAMTGLVAAPETLVFPACWLVQSEKSGSAIVQACMPLVTQPIVDCFLVVSLSD